jgi:hypothetical protein
LDELGEVLRPAVEQARRQPPPEDVVQRSIGRAREIDKGGPPRALISRLVLVAAAAASLMLALAAHPGRPFTDRPTLARTEGQPAGARAEARVGSLPGIFVGRKRVHGLPGPADDYLAISAAQMGSRWADWERGEPKAGRALEAWIEDDDGRELRPSSLRVTASLDDKRSETSVEYLFRVPWPREGKARARINMPAGAFPISRTVQVGDAEPQDVDGEFRLPVGSTARVRVVYYQRSRAACGALLYAYWLPRRIPRQFSCTISVDADLLRGHDFQPTGGGLHEKGGVVTYQLSRNQVRPLGLVILKTANPRP